LSSSGVGDNVVRRVAKEFRNVGRVTVCDVDGGKKAVSSEFVEERPKFQLIGYSSDIN
jgi:hypothetical protein